MSQVLPKARKRKQKGIIQDWVEMNWNSFVKVHGVCALVSEP